MCGIAGIAGFTQPGNVAEQVRRMTRALEHRGPDGEGYFTSGGIALGHRRLAILDLTSAGRQPMTSRDGRFTLVLNGEIFNYLELRDELRGPFRSQTDTEVLLEACAQWGVEEALNRAVGMFALALWDEERGALTLARDRVGEKPLVYYWDGVTFGFASELKALRPLHESRLDPAAVDAYFALGYVPAPFAIFRHTRKLAAGHLLEYRHGRIAEKRWWFPERAMEEVAKTPEQRQHQLRQHVREAVRVRLRSDVPVAVCLSGGVDSSIVAAECAQQGARLEAYTVKLDGDDTDLPWAVQAAQHLGLRHQIIEARSSDAGAQMSETCARYDEPFADSSALPSLTLARALRDRYKVVLTGDGGDEAFAGYSHYEHIAAKQLLKAAAATAGFRDGQGAVGVYVQSKTMFRLGERGRLLNGHAPGDTLSHLLRSDEFLRQASGGALKQALWSDRHLYLANDLTYKSDIALSAYAIEGRAPFLDHRVLEWAQHLDARDLVRGREKKVLLRDAYRGVLPSGILDRPKHGFGAPVGAWLDGPLLKMRRELLPCPLLEKSSQGTLTGHRLWTVLAFARWAQHWGASW
jgi:asparagine synthase (glutamine-hydrolysing)